MEFRGLLRALLANRPAGFTRWWQALRDRALRGEATVCAHLLSQLRQAGAPLSPSETRRLLRWEQLLFRYLTLRADVAGDHVLAEEARRRWARACEKLLDPTGLHHLRIVRLLVAAQPSAARASRLLRPYLDDALQALRGVSQVSILTEFLEEPDLGTRRQALLVLAEINEFEAVAQALRHRDVQTQRDAISLLARKGACPDPKYAVACLNDPRADWFVRCQAALLLGSCPRLSAAADALRRALWDKTHPLVRVAAARGLAANQGAAARAWLLSLHSDPVEVVREAAKTALERLDSQGETSRGPAA